MLSEKQTAKLNRIKLYSTRYEVVLISPEGEKTLLRYTSQRTRSGLMAEIRYSGEKIVKLTGEERFDSLKTWKAEGIHLGNWRVKFSGRTQRDAIIEGELPFIGDF